MYGKSFRSGMLLTAIASALAAIAITQHFAFTHSAIPSAHIWFMVNAICVWIAICSLCFVADT